VIATTDDAITATVPFSDERYLPAGWRWAKLGDVCDFLDSRRVPINETERQKRIAGRSKDQLFPYYGANGQVGWIDDYIFDEPLILLAEDGGNFGSATKPIAYGVSGKYWVNNHAHVLRPRQLVDFDYCLQAIRIRPDVGDLVSGSTRAKLNQETAASIPLPLSPLPEQKRIATILSEQMAAVEQARAAVQAQLGLLQDLVNTYLRQLLTEHTPVQLPLGQALVEMSHGVGAGWHNYRVVGATRAGLAPAKEQVGKSPERYKLVDVGTVFYNPMRILIGSIAMIDEGDEPGITSPDYVVLKTQKGILHSRWFYYWLRSPYGEDFIKTLARGAVRERMLFRRLASAEIHAPPWDVQVKIAEKLQAIPTLQKAIGDQLDAIDKLPATLLRQAFNGEL